MRSLTASALALVVTVPLACSHENKENRAPAAGADAQAFDKRGDLGQDQPGNAPLGAGGTTSDNNVGGTNTTGGSGGSMTGGGTGATGGSTTRGGSGTGGTSP